MLVDVINRFEDFQKLRSQWEAVYDRDPEAQYFLSWIWLSKWLEGDTDQWFILAARPNENARPYVGFFPLRLRTKMRSGGGFYNEITLAGRKLSDYAGFICQPEHLIMATAAFARHLKQSHWAVLRFECLHGAPERIEMLMRHFPSKQFKITSVDDINEADGVDNLVCPIVSLPDDWDTYLGTLSSNTRQKMRRFLRKIDGSEVYDIRLADARSIDDDLNVLLDLWQAKWGDRKGDRLPLILKINYEMLRKCFDSGTLLVPVLTRSEEPLAANAYFVDPIKRALLFFIGGRTQSFNGSPPPGFVLHAFMIRHAIEEGFQSYDFLRGNESYKYLFKPQDHLIRHIFVTTRTRLNLGGRLDQRSLLKVLKRTVDLHQAGEIDQAEIGYKQILKVNPNSATALYGHGQLLATKGKHAAAIRTFRRLTDVQPDSEKAWLRLASSLEQRGRHNEALKAYRELVRRRPDCSTAQNKLVRALSMLESVAGRPS